jgi:hypothetical protein
VSWQTDAADAILAADSEYVDYIAPAFVDLADGGIRFSPKDAFLDPLGNLYFYTAIVKFAWQLSGSKPVGAGENTADALATAVAHAATADEHYEAAAVAVATGAAEQGLTSPSGRRDPDQARINAFRSIAVAVGFVIADEDQAGSLSWLQQLIRWHPQGTDATRWADHHADVHCFPPGALGEWAARA